MYSVFYLCRSPEDSKQFVLQVSCQKITIRPVSL